MKHSEKESLKKELYAKAKAASRNSYSPYSKFRVGAAVKTKSGKIYLGANVENISFGLTICAERVAICNAITTGDKKIEYVAIYCQKGEISPCGACRQFIMEFGKDIEVIIKNKGKLTAFRIIDLLPNSFYSDKLK